MSAAIAARRTRLLLTPAGKALLPIAVLGLVLSLSLVSEVTLATAAAASVLLLAAAGSYLCLRGLTVVPPTPRQAFVGEGFPLELTLENRALFLAARHVFVWNGRGGRRRDQPPSGRVDVLPGRARGRTTTLHRLMERGRHSSLGVVLASSYPFGLVECRREFELDADFLALPCPGRLGDLRRLQQARAGTSADMSRPLAGEEELFGVREWRPGESLRRAHWKLSARRGRTMLREFRGAGRPPVHLILSTLVAQRGAGRHASFERAVRLAATLAQYFLREGHRLRLTIDGPVPTSLYSARGGRTLVVFLAALAEVQPVEGNFDAAALLPATGPRAPSDEVVIAIVCARGAAPAVPESAARLWLDVDSPATERLFRRDTAPRGSPPVRTAVGARGG